MIKALFLIIFGSSLFGGEPAKVSPYLQAPEGYVLDRGDEVEINIYGASMVQVKEKINVLGKILIPNYGLVSLGGKTLPAAEKELNKAMRQRFADSEVSIILTEPRQIRVSIKGEVVHPGEYLLHGYSNPLIALQVAGGITAEGSMRDVLLNKETSIDFYDYLLDGLNVNGMLLKDGDELYVGTANKLIEIEGYVKRPGTYELKENQGLNDLIEYAGGITEEEYEIRINHRSAESVRMRTLHASETGQYIPKDGDIIRITKKADDPEHVVHIVGNVLYPNKYYIISETQNTLKKLLEIATPKMNAKKNIALVYRDTVLVQVGNEDIPLSGCEKIYVVANEVRISGAVLCETEVDYQKGMSTKDYIQAAGGYGKKALKNKTYVVTPDGKLHVEKDFCIIPGSTIVVPRK